MDSQRGVHVKVYLRRLVFYGGVGGVGTLPFVFIGPFGLRVGGQVQIGVGSISLFGGLYGTLFVLTLSYRGVNGRLFVIFVFAGLRGLVTFNSGVTTSGLNSVVHRGQV